MKPIYIHSETVHNYKAPQEIIPFLISLLSPESVLDVGCGLGTWLKVFEEQGISDYIGIDGEYVDKNSLKVSLDKFKEVDLRNPFDLRRKFDLILCLEVAEHIPASDEDNLINSIIAHGDLILFSAAIPEQGGQNHLNEQWPEYWEKKFNNRGFYFYDIIRPEIWDNVNVDWWYKQNIFLASKKKFEIKGKEYRSLIHPENYLLKIKNQNEYYSQIYSGNIGVKFALKLLLKSIWAKFK